MTDIVARVATYADLARLVKLCKRQHEKNDWNFLPFSSAKVKENLVTMIRTPGMEVLVAEQDGELCGLLLAGLDQFFMNNQWYATDVHFVADRGGRELLKLFFRWAQQHGAKACVMGVATADPEGRIARFYAACGMQQVGTAWVKRFDTAQEQAA
jgi:predicted GNAT superfamily acetyltransferase